MQDMSQPPSYQGPADPGYQTDKIIGIIVMVFALCGVAVGGLALLGSSVMTAAGGAAAVAGNNPNGAAAVGATGGFLMLISVVILLLSLASFVVGYGVMKSLRWGFMLGIIVYAVRVLSDLLMLSSRGGGVGGFSLLVGIALLVYCIMRLTGKLGPTPA